MLLGFGNNITSRLASDITSSQTTISIDTGSGNLFKKLLTMDFKNEDVNHTVIAKITLSDIEQTIWEICHLTAVDGDTLTVQRGQEGTQVRGWNSGSLVGNFATRGSENNFVQIEQLQGGDFCYSKALGTDNNLVINIPSTYAGEIWDLKTPIVVSPKSNNTNKVTIQLILGGRVINPTFPVYKANKNELVRNDIVAGVPFIVVLDETKKFFNMINAGSIYDTLQLAQQPGSSTTIPLSQNAVKNYYALKSSQKPFSSGQHVISNNAGSYFSTMQFWPSDGDKAHIGMENNNGRFYILYRDQGNNQNKGQIFFPKGVNGTAGFQNSASKSQNGYWRCGDTGIMFQWGEVNYSTNPPEQDVTINFPIAYQNACLSAQATRKIIANSNPRRNDAGVLLVSYSKSSLRVNLAKYSDDTGDERGFTWFAIGW